MSSPLRRSIRPTATARYAPALLTPTLLALSAAPAVIAPRLTRAVAATTTASQEKAPAQSSSGKAASKRSASTATPRLAQNAPPPTVPPAAPVTNAANPTRATVVAVQGNTVTLDVGTDRGAKVGAVYAFLRNGIVTTQVQITGVRPGESTALILDTNAGPLTVGDAVNFVAVRDLPPNVVPPTTTPTTPVPPATGPLDGSGQPQTPVPGTTTPGTVVIPGETTPPTTGQTTPGAVVAPITARITSIDGSSVTLNAGLSNGLVTGITVPILRNGNVAAVVRVDSATDNTATGTVLWSGDANNPVTVGDSISFAPPTNTVLPGTGTTVVDTAERTPPAAPIKFETGASNAVVPRADRTYEYLAGLASSGLITRYPANIFHDDGTRYHRTAEDITFTRAQIADLVREALQSEGAEQPSGRNRVALDYLTQQYGRELRQVGTDSVLTQPFAQNKGGFRFGLSGQTRARLIGGDTDNVVEPFSERQGGLRSRSGFDVRTNAWAQVGSKINLFAEVDSGSDPSRAHDDRAFTVRKALVSFNANSLLRGLTVEAGRDEMWFGPGHFGTLLLGDTPGGLNLVHTIFKRGSYQVDSVYAPLGHGPAGSSRALYAKNAQVQLGKQTRIGFAESTLGPDSSFQLPQFLATFSPFPIFYAERLANGNNKSRSGNTLVQGYFETSIARGMAGYGELLIDDIGVNSNNNVRNRIGTLVGAHFFTPKDPAKLGLYVEFANLDFRTYLRFNENLDSDYNYYYRGRPFGYPVAPVDVNGSAGAGAESLRFDAYWRVARRLRLGGGLEFADINSEGPLLSRQQVYRLRAAYDLSRDITLNARLQHVSTTNAPFFSGGAPVSRGDISQQLFEISLGRSF